MSTVVLLMVTCHLGPNGLHARKRVVLVFVNVSDRAQLPNHHAEADHALDALSIHKCAMHNLAVGRRCEEDRT